MSQDLTPPSSPESLGSSLASARKQRGLSIEDVSAATRIRTTLIRDIERDEFDHCGGAIYARGHIKAIAHVVGADADELVSEYDRRHRGSTVPALVAAPLPALERARDRDIARSRRRAPHWATAAIVVLAMLATFLGINWLFGDDSSGTGGVPEVMPAPERTISPGPEPTVPTTAPPTTPPQPTSPPVSGVSVQVEAASGPSWVRVESSSGDELFASVLAAGQTREWSDPTQLTVKFGNAPAVRLIVNGQSVGAPCDETVCTVQFPGSSVAG